MGAELTVSDQAAVLEPWTPETSLASTEAPPAQEARPRASEPRRYDFIDALRCFAILGVIFHHLAPRVPGMPRPLYVLAMQGFEGVQLFFVMSAFTLFLSLDSRTRSDRRPYLDFFIRRFFRIAPLFYAGLAFYTLLDYLTVPGGGRASESLGCFLSTLTFTNGWSPRWINRLVPGGWSIAVEMNFYLLVPFLFKVLKDLRLAAMGSFLALLGAAAFRVVVLRVGPHALGPDSGPLLSTFLYYALPLQLPIFCMGFVLFYVVKGILAGDSRRPRHAVIDSWFLLALSIYIMVAVSFSDVSLLLGHVLYGVAFVLLGWSLALYPNPMLVNGVTRFLGKVSFSAYITHFGILQLLEYAMGRGPFRWIEALSPAPRFVVLAVLTVLGTAAVSAVTYRWIESTGIDLGRQVIRRVEASRARRARGRSPALQASKIVEQLA
ncbi:Acyltransferase family protein [Aquisphaera giovannonii]|uniref:Acyltransferase family protein n=1 Tax=Aquisphaera giovannonii TaxID=406548 RepID=A0A5B9W8G0_9BACT|nr:acyltransferase [Aquisphaera giovannonii]QEH36912.1 Acyltransferase family protein [Aquisphaera giovannonii]